MNKPHNPHRIKSISDKPPILCYDRLVGSQHKKVETDNVVNCNEKCVYLDKVDPTKKSRVFKDACEGSRSVCQKVCEEEM